MRVERIKAASMREALDKIKLKLGDDAVILNTRSTKEGIEVIAARDQEQQKTGNSWLDEVIQKDKDIRSQTSTKSVSPPTLGEIENYDRKGVQVNKKEQPVKIPKLTDEQLGWKELMDQDSVANPDEIKNDNRLEQLEEATRTAKEFSELLRDELKSSQEQRKVWIDHEKQLDSLKKQLVDLKESLLRQELSELKQRADELQRKKQEQKLKETDFSIDDSLKTFFKNIEKRLIERGLLITTARAIVSKVEKECIENKWNFNSQTEIQQLKKLILDELKKNISVFESRIPLDGPQIISIVGPHKSGKTTTSLKIALNEALIHNKKVAMILVSSEQEKTFQHLNQLSLATKLPFAVISGVEDLKNTIKVHSDKDVIIIDFALPDFQSVQDYHKVIQDGEIHLTISLDNDLDHFKKLRKTKMHYDAIIFTHIDKIKNIGTVIELSKMMKKPISFIGNGTIIPDDVEYVNETKLSHMILKG